MITFATEIYATNHINHKIYAISCVRILSIINKDFSNSLCLKFEILFSNIYLSGYICHFDLAKRSTKCRIAILRYLQKVLK